MLCARSGPIACPPAAICLCSTLTTCFLVGAATQLLQTSVLPRLAPGRDPGPGPLRPRFLGGVLDFTGELNRYAIARATQRDREAVARCRDLVDALMGRFLQVGIGRAVESNGLT